MCKIKLVIDPGHGGNDPGARSVAFALREADLALKIALVLRRLCDASGRFEPTLTRDSDRTVDLERRTRIANGLGAYFVSIHLNAAENEDARGIETWCFSETDADGESESVGHRMARCVQKELQLVPFENRGVRAIYSREKAEFIYRKLWVLRKTQMPAVLVECGFLTNRADAARYHTDKHGKLITEIAWRIFRGLDAALNSEGEN